VPEEAGHRLLSWDTHAEHLHYFTVASLAALFQRSGLQLERLTSGHFESVVYPDCLRLEATRRTSPESRRKELVARFCQLLPRPFAVYGVGGDFHNYVEPLIDALPVTALIDSSTERHGDRIGGLTVVPFDSARHGALPILVSSVRFKSEITSILRDQHGVAADCIVGLDEVYGERRL
jgi:hypothetical protein